MAIVLNGQIVKQALVRRQVKAVEPEVECLNQFTDKFALAGLWGGGRIWLEIS